MTVSILIFLPVIAALVVLFLKGAQRLNTVRYFLHVAEPGCRRE